MDRRTVILDAETLPKHSVCVAGRDIYRVYVSVKVGYTYERCWIAQRAAGGSKLQSMSQEGGHLVWWRP